MMKKILYSALVVLSLVSCTNDDILEVKRDTISFDVVSENVGRSGTIYSNTEKPETFILYAVHHSTNADATVTKSMYINGVEVTNNGGSKYVFSDGIERYWPESGSLTFYAVVEPKGTYVGDGENVAHYDRNKSTIDEISYNLLHAESISGIGVENVNDAIADQQDFIYAVKAGQTKIENSGTPVKLNFRHAYSQIVFNGKIGENEKIYVKVKAINLQQLDVYGKFTLPHLSTDDNVVEDTEDGASKLNNQGTWNVMSHPDSDTGGYRVELEGENQIISSTTPKSLTFDSSALLLIPQKKSVKIIVDCEIYNVAGDEFNPATDVKIYSGTIALTPSVEWKQGIKYIYTLIFDGNTLQPISLDLTVDDFITDSDDDN